MIHYSDSPKVRAVSTADPSFLFLEFDNGQKRHYDVSPLLEMEMFAPLKNIALFRAAKVECRGWAVSWSDDIDISNQELWANSKPC
ncbi:MAG: DUF2442 domain-containing protein [Gammaproteobacteria bacterium]